MNQKITLAVQKSGRISEETFDLLRKSGLDFQITNRSLKVTVSNFDMEILLLRSNDIPEIVAEGIADIGIVGQNTLVEKGYKVKEVQPLGFGKCSLCLAYCENDKERTLEGKRIATSYPRLLEQYLCSREIETQIVDLSGSVEIAPKLDIADLICDLVSTGSTLKSNGLVRGETVFESEVVLVSGCSLPSDKESILQKFLLRINSVLDAKNYKYIVMNAERKNLGKIEECLPGLKKPTVSSLADERYVSVSSVVEEDVFWDTIEGLKEVGARDLLILPVENLVR